MILTAPILTILTTAQRYVYINNEFHPIQQINVESKGGDYLHCQVK
jgi:hypothetical protein